MQLKFIKHVGEGIYFHNKVNQMTGSIFKSLMKNLTSLGRERGVGAVLKSLLNPIYAWKPK